MAAYVADEVGSDALLYELPPLVATLEAVVVATRDDGLQRQVGQRLQHGEVRAGARRARLFVDLDGDVRDDVLGPWCAVVVDDHVVPQHPLDGVRAAHRSGTAREGGV